MSSFDDVADSTDWLPTSLPGLAAVEAALRCQVCKDFFQTPVVTSCAHTFCSLCIRKCLASDGRCPTCRATDQDSKLRRNWAVEEVVDSFQGARNAALELARKEAERARRKEEGEEEGGEGDGVEGPQDGKRRSSRKSGVKRKLDETDIEEDGAEERSGQARKTRSQSRKDVTGDAVSQPEVIDVDAAGDEDDKDGEYVPADGLVPCPICGKRMKEETVYPHLDQCGKEEQKRAPPQHPLQKRPPPQQSSEISRISQLNYGLLNEVALRKKVQASGIPSWGTRQLLIRRHTEWVSIYNSNSDSTRPRSKRELLNDLEVWEKSQGGRASTATSSIMKKDFDSQGWADSNKDQFAELIANARRKRATAASTEPQKEKENAQEKDMVAESNTTDTKSETSMVEPSNAPSQQPSALNRTYNVTYGGEQAKTPSQQSHATQGSVGTFSGGRYSHTLSQQSPAYNGGGHPLAPSPHPSTPYENYGALHGGGHPNAVYQKQSTPHGHYSSGYGERGNFQHNYVQPGNQHSYGKPSSLSEHLAEPATRTLPMFQLPEQPLRDLDGDNSL